MSNQTLCPHCGKPINVGSLLGHCTSERKAKASRTNGRKGGRPRKAIIGAIECPTAAEHFEADKACGREWECSCSACKLERKRIAAMV